MFVGENYLEGGVEVRHVEADEARGSERPLQQLHVEIIGQDEEQVDQDQSRPAPVAPLVPSRCLVVLRLRRPQRRFRELVLALLRIDELHLRQHAVGIRLARLEADELAKGVGHVTHVKPPLLYGRYR